MIRFPLIPSFAFFVGVMGISMIEPSFAADILSRSQTNSQTNANARYSSNGVDVGIPNDRSRDRNDRRDGERDFQGDRDDYRNSRDDNRSAERSNTAPGSDTLNTTAGASVDVIAPGNNNTINTGLGLSTDINTGLGLSTDSGVDNSMSTDHTVRDNFTDRNRRGSGSNSPRVRRN